MNILSKAVLGAAALACSTGANAATVVYTGSCEQFCTFNKVNGTVNQVTYTYTFALGQSFVPAGLSDQGPFYTYRITGDVIVSGAASVSYDITQSSPDASFFFTVPISQVLTGDLAYYEGAGQFVAGAFTIPTYTYVSGRTFGAQVGGRTFSRDLRIAIDYTPVPFVPEPSTWALMLAGFGMVGYSLRRRRVRYEAVTHAG